MKRASARGKRTGTRTHRALLLEKKADLLSSLGVKFDIIASMGHVNEEDQAQVSYEEFVSLCLNGLDYKRLKLVEEALDRLDSGEYGICLGCDEPIAPKRLRAVPWAMYCVECQERLGALPEEHDGAPAPLAEVVSF